VLSWWLFQGTPVSATNKTDYQDIAEVLLKVVLNTNNLNPLMITVKPVLKGHL
jgi:cobalamin-dependent methionine synthase I